MNTTAHFRPWNFLVFVFVQIVFLLVSCEEIKDEMYSDLEMVIPEATASFNVQATACETKTIVSIDQVKFSGHLDSLDIQVDEVRFYINDDLLEICSEAPYAYEGLIDNLPDGDYSVRMEYDLSGEGFLPGTGCTRKDLKVDSLSNPFISLRALQMDSLTYFRVDTLDFPYKLEYGNLTPQNIRFYIDDVLVSTDDVAPYSFDGFINQLHNGEHHLEVKYEVVTENGLATDMVMDTVFETDTVFNNYFSVKALHFDEKTYLETDTIHVPYLIEFMGLSVERFHLSVNDAYIATDLKKPSCFNGFVNLPSEEDNYLQIRYEVSTKAGDIASVTVTQPFTVRKNTNYLSDTAINFPDRTYLQVNEVSLPYVLSETKLNVQELRFYVDGTLVGTDSEQPFSFDAFIDKLADETHTLQIVYDVLTEDGSSASYSFSKDLSPMNNNNSIHLEKPTSENNHIFKVKELYFTWSNYKCQLEIEEIRYYLDGVHVSTVNESPYLLEMENLILASGSHTLRIEYDVKDSNDVSVTCEEIKSFYILEDENS